MDHYIARRIEFLLDAARYEDKKDQVVTYALRVLSNHATIGKDAGSAQIKKLNKRISSGAFELLRASTIEEYCSLTINEHPKPILQTWNWLKQNAQYLTADDVWHEFINNPMITVTKKEDNLIKSKGYTSVGDFTTRYEALGISVEVLDIPPYQLLKSK